MTGKKFCFKTESSQLYPPFIHSRTFYSIFTPVACSTPGNYVWYMRNHVHIPLSLHILNQLKRTSLVQISNSILRNKNHFESQRKQISRSKMVPFNSHGKSVQVCFFFFKARLICSKNNSLQNNSTRVTPVFQNTNKKDNVQDQRKFVMSNCIITPVCRKASVL